MRVSVFGLGYVGCVTAACLAAEGHKVVGVDVNPAKVELIKAGQSPMVEPGLADLIAQGIASGGLSATLDALQAVKDSDLSLICVGTPSSPDGRLDLHYVQRVCEDIGEGLRQRDDYHVVVVRSTMLPGSTESTVVPALERSSGRSAGPDFGVAYNPEFLREGSAIADFYQPSRTVIGELDRKSGDIAASLYLKLEAPLVRTEIGLAELIKYADNAFHALKVAFANEIGVLCAAEGIDGRQLMEAFCLDTKLNLSPTYLRPGYAFGGSCLPKDLRALNHRLQERAIAAPVLASVLESNQRHKERGLNLVKAVGKRKIAVLGLSFKPNTDDLRESPAVELVDGLLDSGYDLKVYDRNVSLARLMGTNREYIEREIPHIASLLVPDIGAALAGSDVVVVTSSDPDFRKLPGALRPDQVLIDLVHAVDDPGELGDRYIGIAW